MTLSKSLWSFSSERKHRRGWNGRGGRDYETSTIFHVLAASSAFGWCPWIAWLKFISSSFKGKQVFSAQFKTKTRLCYAERTQKAPPVNTNVQPSFQAHANRSELVFRCFHPPRIVSRLPGWKTNARLRRAGKKTRTARRNGRNPRMFRFSSIEGSISLLAALKAVETVCDDFPRSISVRLWESKKLEDFCVAVAKFLNAIRGFPHEMNFGDFPSLLTNHQMEITLDCGKQID